MRFLLFLSGLGSVLGGLVFLIGIVTAKGAPQEAAVAAMAIAAAVLPYVLARAVYLWRVADVSNLRHQELLDALSRLEGNPGGRTLSKQPTDDRTEAELRDLMTRGYMSPKAFAEEMERRSAAPTESILMGGHKS